MNQFDYCRFLTKKQDQKTKIIFDSYLLLDVYLKKQIKLRKFQLAK